jgi:hypothetical protein
MDAHADCLASYSAKKQTAQGKQVTSYGQVKSIQVDRGKELPALEGWKSGHTKGMEVIAKMALHCGKDRMH